jgi:DNA mismatch repair ATPase MutS
MLLKTVISEFNGLRYLIDNLEIMSAPGRRVLFSTEMMTHRNAIEQELSFIEQVIAALNITEKANALDKAAVKLMQVRDLKGTLKNLAAHNTLDDIELFELKHFILLSEEIRSILQHAGIAIVLLPNLAPALSVLDPEQNRIPSFYIYDSYSTELAQTRKAIKHLKNQQELLPNDTTATELDQLREKACNEEDRIRQLLSEQLYMHHAALENALNQIAHLDLLQAKAKQAIKLNLCKPEVTEAESCFSGIFNPQLKALHVNTGKRYQPIDIELYNNPCLITGANMAGKTVLLKTVALAQYLFQFGFYVPAQKATMSPVKAILFCIDDEQSELSGLSSYAAEILKVNHIIKTAKTNHHLLVLIDELARTTNPLEGSAIVTAVAEILSRHHIRSLITTHYSGLTVNCRKLRVKGFVEGMAGQIVNRDNISDFIDYSLVNDDKGSVPHEALQIAEILGVDQELVNLARNNINTLKTNTQTTDK